MHGFCPRILQKLQKRDDFADKKAPNTKKLGEKETLDDMKLNKKFAFLSVTR